MSWLLEAVTRGSHLAQQDKIDALVKEEEKQRKVAQEQLLAEQKQKEWDSKYSPWLQVINPLLNGFNTKEMTDLGYHMTPVAYGEVLKSDWMRGSIDSEYFDYQDPGSSYSASGILLRGYFFGVERVEKRIKKSILSKPYRTHHAELKCGFWMLGSDDTSLFFYIDTNIQHWQTETHWQPEKSTELKSPAELAVFLKDLLMKWVAESERNVRVGY